MFSAFFDRRWRSTLAALALAFILFSPAVAPASSVRIDPVRVDIPHPSKTGSVTLTNEGKTPVAFRTYVQSWRQENGANVYEDSTALITSPPLATIAPGKSQLIRVGLRKGAPTGFYRLMLEEIPKAMQSAGVKMAIRFDLPLFVVREEARDFSVLTWSTQRSPDGGMTVEARNGGTKFVRLDSRQVSAQIGVEIDTAVAFGTVLPGSTMRWNIGRASAPSRGSHRGQGEGKPGAAPGPRQP